MPTARTIKSHKVLPPPEPIPVIPDEPLTAPAEDAVAPFEEVTLDAEGRFIASPDERSLFIRLGGVRYEHVAEMPDGRWIYAKS